MKNYLLKYCIASILLTHYNTFHPGPDLPLKDILIFTIFGAAITTGIVCIKDHYDQKYYADNPEAELLDKKSLRNGYWRNSKNVRARLDREIAEIEMKIEKQKIIEKEKNYATISIEKKQTPEESYLLKLKKLKNHPDHQDKKLQEYLDRDIANIEKKIAELKNNSSCSENMTTMDTENKDTSTITQLKRDKDRDHKSEADNNRDFFFDRMRYIDPAENNILHLMHSFHPHRSTDQSFTSNWYTKTVLPMFKHISNQQKIPTPQLSHDTHNPFYYFCP